MSLLAGGLVVLANGAWSLATSLLSPVSLLVVVSALSLSWLAQCEVDELDRMGRKPKVPWH